MNEWLAQVLAVLDAAAPPVAEAARRRHAEHNSSEHPILLLVGEFSAGKTTLLRRLLVDERRDVPEDLVVGAGPTTVAVRDVEVHGWCLRDTPGLGSGRTTHDLVTEERTWFADAFLILLMPTLFSPGDDVADLLTGRTFHPAGW